MRGSAGTIKWGTSNLAYANFNTAIIESINFDSKEEVAEIEDNAGHTKIEVGIDNGWDATLKLVYDSGTTYPVFMDVATLKTLRDQTNAKNVVVQSISDEISRKKEGMVTIKVAYRPNVNVALTA